MIKIWNVDQDILDAVQEGKSAEDIASCFGEDRCAINWGLENGKEICTDGGRCYECWCERAQEVIDLMKAKGEISDEDNISIIADGELTCKLSEWNLCNPVTPEVLVHQAEKVDGCEVVKVEIFNPIKSVNFDGKVLEVIYEREARGNSEEKEGE